MTTVTVTEEQEREELHAALKEDWRDAIDDIWLDGWEHVTTLEGDNRRWSRYDTVILKAPSGRYWSWGYEHGLTEYQEHHYDGDAPVRVEPVEKTVTVTKWKRVSK